MSEERRYNAICEAIYRTAAEKHIAPNVIIRKWIRMFECSRVVGFDRDEFLDECIKAKKNQKGVKKE